MRSVRRELRGANRRQWTVSRNSAGNLELLRFDFGLEGNVKRISTSNCISLDEMRSVGLRKWSIRTFKHLKLVGSHLMLWRTLSPVLIPGLKPEKWERLPLDEVFEQLRTSKAGLTSEDAEARLKIFGPNKLEEKPENKFLKFLSFMWNPLSWVMEAAAVMAIALANGGGQGPDWQDFVGIICLLIINSTISFIEENNAGNAAASLMARLAPKTKSALTGESMPVTKRTGDEVYSGSTCKQGEIEAVVIATGVHSFFGKAAHLVDSTEVVDSESLEEKEEIAGKVHAIIDKFAERGLRSLGVAIQEVPEKSKDSPGGPWKFCGLLPLFDPPRHDSAETIRRALNLGVCVKMITGDQLAIAKETGRRLGMGTNMYPSSSLLGRQRDENEVLPVDELIEKADGFAGVFPGINSFSQIWMPGFLISNYELHAIFRTQVRDVKILQEKKHIVGMTGDGVNDAPALKKADIGIAVADATDAARSASDIVLTEPGLSVIISAIYAVSITIRIVLGFMLLALIWEYDFPPFMVLIIAILNDGTIMTIAQDRVKPSPRPDSWKLNEIFATGVVIGTYLALVTVLFYWVAAETTFFESALSAKLLYLLPQSKLVISGEAWDPVDGCICGGSIGCYRDCSLCSISFASISGIGWGWAGVIWLYSLIFYIPLDIIKFIVRYALSGQAWNLVFDRKTAFTSRKDYGKEDREAKWVLSQRTLQGLMSGELEIRDRGSSMLAEQARRRAEIARLGELHTLRGHVESVVRLKNLDLNRFSRLIPSKDMN
ncbi:hypothetical protein C3L33_14759, partial [Rhododendron williamsianum]